MKLTLIVLLFAALIKVVAAEHDYFWWLELGNKNKVIPCDEDEDCPSFDVCINKECVHKELFPLFGIEIGGGIIIAIVMAICSAAGTGGGELNILLLTQFFGFTARESAPLSGVFILISACCRFIINFR